MTRVKICGVRDPETALVAAEAGADFIGIVLAQSRRRVTPELCHEIVAAIHERRRVPGPIAIAGPEPGEVSARSWFLAWNEAIEEVLFQRRPLVVGVFADQRADDVNAITEAARLDLVQIAGGEGDDYVRKIERPALRVVHVATGMGAEEIAGRAPAGIGQAVMLDSANGHARGGTGTAFDWTVAAEFGATTPLMLAGGLDPENVADAIRQAEPWAVDVSSGVESRGTKDPEKIREFIKRAKEAGR